jgi:hypothetical protein
VAQVVQWQPYSQLTIDVLMNYPWQIQINLPVTGNAHTLICKSGASGAMAALLSTHEILAHCSWFSKTFLLSGWWLVDQFNTHCTRFQKTKDMLATARNFFSNCEKNVSNCEKIKNVESGLATSNPAFKSHLIRQPSSPRNHAALPFKVPLRYNS